MIDDEFQLPWSRRAISPTPACRSIRSAVLLDTAVAGETRLARMLREMALVSTMTGPYALEPTATTSSASSSATPRTGARRAGATATPATPTAASRWTSNAIWAPRALEAISSSLASLPGWGSTPRRSTRSRPKQARLRSVSISPTARRFERRSPTGRGAPPFRGGVRPEEIRSTWAPSWPGCRKESDATGRMP